MSETKGQRALRMRFAGLSNAEIAAALNMTKDRARGLISETRKSQRERTPPREIDYHVAIEAFLEASEDAIKKTTHIVIPDTQCKPGGSLEHLRWAGKYIAERKPDTVIHLGDHWDFPSLSSYEKKGSRWFEGRRVQDDIAAGNQGLDLLMEGMGNFRPGRMVLLRGNHEDRLTRFISENPALEGVFGFDLFNDVSHGWEVVPYLQPIEIDGLVFCHYFYNPANGRPYGGNIDTMLRNIGHSFVQGHRQGLSVGRRELSTGHTQRGLVAGSFYEEPEDYRGPQAAFEWRGILVLHEVADGNYDLMEVSMGFLRRRFGL
jgi:hypothetical protein